MKLITPIISFTTLDTLSTQNLIFLLPSIPALFKYY